MVNMHNVQCRRINLWCAFSWSENLFFFYQSVAHDQSKWRYEHFTHPIVNLLEWIHKHKNTLPPKLNMMQRLHSSAQLHCALYRLSIPIGHDWKMFVLIIGFNYCLLLKRVSSIDIYEYVNEYKHWMLPKIVFQFPIVLLFHLPGNQLENNHLSILPHRLEKKIKFRRSYNINPFTTAGEVTISSSGWHSIDTHCLYILHSRIINTNTKFKNSEEKISFSDQVDGSHLIYEWFSQIPHINPSLWCVGSCEVAFACNNSAHRVMLQQHARAYHSILSHILSIFELDRPSTIHSNCTV